MDRFDTWMTWLNAIGAFAALYIALRVHTATKSMWKSIGAFTLVSLVVGLLTILWAASYARRHPCMLQEIQDHVAAMEA